MTPQELRNSIIKKALEGKLVNNINDNSELAEILKRARLKSKSQPITEDEIEIEHPDNWIDFRIAEIFDIRNGFTPLRTNEEFWKNGTINWFTVDDIHKQGRYITDTKVKINSCACTNDRIAPPNSLFICCTASVGEYALSKIPMTSNQQFNALSVKDEFISLIDMEFFLAIAPFFKDRLLRIAGKTTFPFISVKKLGNLVFSIPCIEEQKRIVAKIEELMPLVDRYENAWNKLEAFNKAFPSEMEKSLFQYAMQGKLVSQNKSDGSGKDLLEVITKVAREKGLKIKQSDSISDDDIPFDIPDNWTWCRLENIFCFINGDRGKNYPSKDKLHESGGIPFISAINMNNGTVNENGLLYVDEKQYNLLGSGKLNKDDFVFCLRGSLGKFCKYPFEKGAIASSLVILRKIGLIEDGYIFAYLSSPLVSYQIGKMNNGTAQPNLGARDVAKFLIPIPPLEEQKRIVAKIEELLPLCRKLIK